MKNQQAGAKKNIGHHSDSEEKASSDEDDQDDYVDHLPTAKEKGKNQGRASVSAEAFGDFNKKKAFKPRVIPKKQE